jgi:hypothetical protein
MRYIYICIFIPTITILRDICPKFWLMPKLTRFIYSSGLSSPRSWRVLELSRTIRTISATGVLNSVSSSSIGNFTMYVCLLTLSSTFPCSTVVHTGRHNTSVYNVGFEALTSVLCYVSLGQWFLTLAQRHSLYPSRPECLIADLRK